MTNRFIQAICAGIFASCIASAAVAQADTLLNCSSCHTLDISKGERPAPVYPILNGQPARYLERQLWAYRTERRAHRQMRATALALGAGGAPAMARMYADAPKPNFEVGQYVQSLEGEALAINGDWDRGLAPCASCHVAPDEEAVSARSAPWLHGQQERYLASTLRAYANGTRRTDPMGRMRAYAAMLSAEEIDALAAYYAGWTLPQETSE